MVGPVQIEFLEGPDVLIIRGHLRDVEAVKAIIEQIEKLTKETEPEIKVHPIQFADCQMMATLVNQVYQQVYLSRQGYVFITALVRPNALLLVGRKENVAKAIELATKLDGPVAPEAQTRVFFLKYATAGNVQATLQTMYPTGQVGAGLPGAFPGAAAAAGAVTGLAPQVRAVVDFRTNALIVQASPRDMAEVEALIARLDTDEMDTVNQIRIFQLKHILATNLASILDTAVRVQGTGVTGTAPGGPPRRRYGVWGTRRRPSRHHGPDRGRPAFRHASIRHDRRQRAGAIELRDPHRRAIHGQRPEQHAHGLRPGQEHGAHCGTR